MRIDSPGGIRSTSGPRKSERAGSGRAGEFRSLLDTAETDSGPTAMSAAGGVSTLFALQEVEDPVQRDRRGAKRGDGILDRLEELRLGLLTGTVSQSTLDQLRALARQQAEGPLDPRLQDIIDQIELRAEVELAKLAQRRAGNR